MASTLTRGRRPWHDGLPEVTAEIDCGGERHGITWRRGRLVLEDHDVLAERSLAALGGKPATCIEVLDAWRTLSGSENLLELLLDGRELSPDEFAFMRDRHEAELKAARELPERFRARAASIPQGRQLMSQVERQAAEQIEREERLWAHALIRALPPALRRTLALAAIVRIGRRWHDAEFRYDYGGQIEAELLALAAEPFEASLRAFRRNVKRRAGTEPEMWVRTPGEPPTCAAWADAAGPAAVLSLPISWFPEVWAHGLALVDGCFVTSIASGSPDEGVVRVQALRWERQDMETSKAVEAPAVLTRGADGGWRLRWV